MSSIAKIAMPAIYNVREFAEAGGAGIYVASIAVIALLVLAFPDRINGGMSAYGT